ncbi:MAG: hypothetical protein RI973_1998 [Bacteroidota bacterium]|jgi:AraC-like DNA-binding protein
MKVKLEAIPPDEGRSYRLLTPRLNDLFFWHYHPEYEIVYIEGASGTRHIGEHISAYQDSDLAFIGPHIPHLNFDYGIKSPYEKVVVQLREDFLGQAFLQSPELKQVRQLFDRSKGGIVFSGATKREAGKILMAMPAEKPFRQLLLLLEVFQLLANSREYTTLGAKPIESNAHFREQQRIKQVQNFVEQHYRRKIDVRELASLTHLSTAAFCRFFKKNNDLTFTEYINRYRIQRAQQLLLQGSSVTDACYMCGFENLSYFNKTFKKLSGENPTAFKRRIASNLV